MKVIVIAVCVICLIAVIGGFIAAFNLLMATSVGDKIREFVDSLS